MNTVSEINYSPYLVTVWEMPHWTSSHPIVLLCLILAVLLAELPEEAGRRSRREARPQTVAMTPTDTHTHTLPQLLSERTMHMISVAFISQYVYTDGRHDTDDDGLV